MTNGTNGIFSINDKHTQSEYEHNRLSNQANQANQASNILESLINLSVSITILLCPVKSKLSFPYNRVLRVKGTMSVPYGISKCDSRSIAQITYCKSLIFSVHYI